MNDRALALVMRLVWSRLRSGGAEAPTKKAAGETGRREADLA